MALKIRLARHGAKKRPYYRIVVADSRAPRDGRYIERIGSYNPLLAKTDDNRVILDADKAKDWLAKGARPTDRVARFLGAAGLWDWKPGNNPNKGKPGAKALELIEARKEKEEARQAAEAEAKAAADEASAAADAAVAEADQGGGDKEAAEAEVELAEEIIDDAIVGTEVAEKDKADNGEKDEVKDEEKPADGDASS